MTATSYDRGHLIFWDGEHHRYVDTNEIAPGEGEPGRSCPRCGKMPDADGHDACLGFVPGVKAACCGHGVRRGYLNLTDSTFNFDIMLRNWCGDIIGFLDRKHDIIYDTKECVVYSHQMWKRKIKRQGVTKT